MATKQWPLIRQWLRKYYNQAVNDFFKALSPDIDIKGFGGKTATKAVCLIGATDSQSIAALKRQNFDWIKEELGFSNTEPIHPFVTLPGESLRGEAQVQLWFYEKRSVAKREGRGRHPAHARISYRIKEDWNPAQIKAHALEIRNKFAKPIFSFDKGERKITYFDKKKALLFIMSVSSEAEAKKALTPVFDLINQTPDWNKLTESTASAARFVKRQEKVLGKTVTLNPRPSTTVYFDYAIAKIFPLPDDVPLVDTTRKYWNACYIENNPFLMEPEMRHHRPRLAPLL